MWESPRKLLGLIGSRRLLLENAASNETGFFLSNCVVWRLWNDMQELYQALKSRII